MDNDYLEIEKRLQESADALKKAMGAIGIIPFVDDKFEQLPIESKTALVHVFDILNYTLKQHEALRVMIASSLFATQNISLQKYTEILGRFDFGQYVQKAKRIKLEQVKKTYYNDCFDKHKDNPIHEWIMEKIVPKTMNTKLIEILSKHNIELPMEPSNK